MPVIPRLFGNDKTSERIAKALENIATLMQTDLASRGILVAFDNPPEEEGEAWLTDLDKLGEIEARKDKYEQEVGIRPADAGTVGPLGPGGEEWPPEAPIPSVEELQEREREIGRSAEGFGGTGPENAESDSETFEGGGGEEGPPSGHIPR